MAREITLRNEKKEEDIIGYGTTIHDSIIRGGTKYYRNYSSLDSKNSKIKDKEFIKGIPQAFKDFIEDIDKIKKNGKTKIILILVPQYSENINFVVKISSTKTELENIEKPEDIPFYNNLVKNINDPSQANNTNDEDETEEGETKENVAPLISFTAEFSKEICEVDNNSEGKFPKQTLSQYIYRRFNQDSENPLVTTVITMCIKDKILKDDEMIKTYYTALQIVIKTIEKTFI